jgi:hypothetical protein
MLTLSRPDSTPITRWEDWTPPKKDYHWQPGHSAMELAKAWFRSGSLSVPSEIAQMLSSVQRFRDIEFVRGVPEHVTALPIRGEGRNHDLWLLGRTAGETVTVCVEAKADEAFGNYTVAGYRQHAVKRIEQGKPTKVPKRIDALLGIVGQSINAWADVRYQLLTAIAGTILQAQEDAKPKAATAAIFIVHEFPTAATTEPKRRQNAADFARLLNVLGIREEHTDRPQLLGPVRLASVDCYLGKVSAPQ